MSTAIRFAAFGVLFAALSSCSMFDYSNMVVHKYALVYGVTIYTTAFGAGSSPNLQYPDADATSMVSLLRSQGYTVKYRIVNSSGDAVYDLGSGQTDAGAVGQLQTSVPSGSSSTGGTAADAFAPSKTNILTDIQGIAPSLGPNDVLLVYFSGHGTQDTSVSPAREYFDPYGSVMQYTADDNYYDFPVPSMRDDELRSAFDSISTPRKVLILDTCNSGGFVGNQAEVDWTAPSSAGTITLVSPVTLFAAIANYATFQSSPTGLSPYGTAQVISAAGRDELSYETTSYGHGVMTYWLLQGLAGPADLNHDGHITVLEAYAYAKAGVDQNWNPAVGPASSFEPHVSGGPVDFELF